VRVRDLRWFRPSRALAFPILTAIGASLLLTHSHVLANVKELLLISQDTSFYGVDRGERGALARLLRDLNRVEGLEWIRMLYLYPTTIGDDVLEAVASAPAGFPIGGIASTETEQRVLRLREREVVRMDLHSQDEHVNVVEKIQIHMRHIEDDRLGAAVGVHHPHLGDIAAAKHANGRLLVDACAAAFPLSVEEALDVGQKGHELGVMPFLKQTRVARELVYHLPPRVV